MICVCKACKYRFEADAFLKGCPDCGKEAVRAATDDEIEEYRKIRAEIELEEDSDAG